MQLTSTQKIYVETARKALEKSKDSDNDAYTCGALAYHLGMLLDIVADVSGGE